jgi:type I restriction-modification system DNA methylase subunit
MSDAGLKADARARVAALVESFQRHEADYLRPTYNETQVRTDFITPLLEAFGWDVHNAAGQPLGLREVIEEATVDVGDERLSKKPDYELRLARQRKFFVEAKKPSVSITTAKAPAFQTRRYGYSASLPISVLTNFHVLAIYDCQHVPEDAQEAHVARIGLFRYDQFDAHFDELWGIFSRETVYSGAFDARFSVGVTRHGANQFDDFFLRQVRHWRELLAADIHANTPGLNSAELTYAVQRFLSRIVFLRICEDREIEKYATLQNLGKTGTFVALMKLIERADAFYDSGIFRLLDEAALGIQIGDKTLQTVISELYYPASPYTFAVVEPEVLGEIYEQFLGEVITVDGAVVEIVSKPEVRESGGVVPTPRYIVDAIVERTLTPLLAGKSPADLAGFTVADICCGSGNFLIAAYEALLDHHLAWYLANKRPSYVGQVIYEAGSGIWRLTYEEKRRILETHIRGVDIDANAVEVACLSLMLKLIENETIDALKDYVRRHRSPALPSLDDALRAGNSLVSHAEWAAVAGQMPPALADKINPFDWSAEFPDEVARGGFNAIVGNPPYIRIQNMATYSPEEVGYYQNPASPYATARQDNFDKYALFIERYIGLIPPAGRLGVIVPHKFMTIQSGRALRHLIAASQLLREVVHFGAKPVFGRSTANYTCIMILDRSGTADVQLEHVQSLDRWRYRQPGLLSSIPAANLTDDAWQFASAETRELFDRIRAAHPSTLDAVADIFVGLQTSADKVFIVRSTRVTADTVTVSWNEQDWDLEREALRPFLRKVQLHPYLPAEPNAWIIFPYDIVGGPRGPKAELIQPADFSARYPVCLRYLEARREELAGRDVTGGEAGQEQWYQYGRSQSLTKFAAPKIILPALSVTPRYTYDDANIMVTGGGNGPYYCLRAEGDSGLSDLYLLAVLNHPVSEAFVRTNTSIFGGGYYSHGKQFIGGLPIPIPDEPERGAIERLVRSLINAHVAAVQARLPHRKRVREREAVSLMRQVEERISALFGLSDADLAVIQAVPIPT